VPLVTRFYNAKNIRPVEFHGKVVALYGEGAMTGGISPKWRRLFKDATTNLHYEY
jgi:hypothetical protein